MKQIIVFMCFGFLSSTYAQNYQDQGKLVASDRKALTELGASVDISGDYAVVGSTKEYMNELGGDSLVGAGAVYIFKRQPNNSWNQVQKIVNSDRQDYDNFGVDVSIDGTTLIVGASGQDFDENGLSFVPASGAAYIYDRQLNGQWTFTQKIVCTIRQITVQTGKIVDISGDYLLMGSYNDYTDENYANSLSNTGAIYMFKKAPGGTWIETEKIVASDRGIHEWFGIDSHLNGDRLIIGAEGTNHAGKAYAFVLNSGTGFWDEQQVLSAGDVVSGGNFAQSVSINADFAVVGAPSESEDELGLNTINDAGAIYIYELNQVTGMYDSLQKIAMPDRITHGTLAYFGRDLELTNDNELYVGSFLSSYAANNSGAVYNFDLDISGLFVFDEKFGALDGIQSDMVGERLAVSGKHIIMSTRANDTDENGLNSMTDSGGAFIVKLCKTASEVNVDACESFLLPSGSSLITSSGIYSDIIPNLEGCDSVVTLNVTIHSLPVNTISQIDAITSQSDEMATTSTYQWLDCDNNFSSIAGETESQFTAITNGNYAVEVTSEFGCADTSSCISVTSVGLEEFVKQPVRIFPNPTKGSFVVDGISENSNLTIVDLSGALVYRQNAIYSTMVSMDLSLEKGCYIVHVWNEVGTYNLRVVIE